MGIPPPRLLPGVERGVLWAFFLHDKIPKMLVFGFRRENENGELAGFAGSNGHDVEHWSC